MSQGTYRGRMMEAFRRRMFFYVALVALYLVLIIFQIINLQLIQGRDYSRKSKLNMEDYIPITAPRGEIYDRNFNPANANNVTLVTNRASFDITAIPAKFENRDQKEKTLKKLSKLLNLNYDELIKDFINSKDYERKIIKEDVPFETVVLLATHQDQFPFIEWRDVPVRVYNYSNMFSHSIGYTGLISKEEFGTLRDTGYKQYQKVGKIGIEKEYDNFLRGSDGYMIRIADVRNRTEGEEVGQLPSAGNNLIVTIDYNVQKAANDALDGMKGSCVVIKPSTGEVIALVSKPDFDPNIVISKNNSQIVKDLYNDKNNPFLNRVIQSRYPPASTFKLVTAVTALEEEKWNPNWTVYCPGKYTLKGLVDKDFYCYETHGTSDLYRAIGKSCSVYFYTVGYKVGPTNIMKYAAYFGLNEKTGIDLAGEISGFIPSKEWKLKTFGTGWFDGDTINLSIGQGFLAVTPVGMANFLCGLVNNGVIYKPQMVKEIRSADNSKIIQSYNRIKSKEIPLSPETVIAVKQGMRNAVTMGTAIRLNSLKVPVAGKTGTAQTRSKRKDDASQHGWFLGFAPYYTNQENNDNMVVVCVMVEYGVAGAVSAVPVAEKVFYELNKQGYFNVQ